MNKLQVINDERFKIFSKENLGSVRTVLLNNEVWFCIKDVCDILELTNPTVVAKRLDEDEKAKFDLGLKNGELTNFTNESGLYTLILRSDKPEAKPFRKWITSEVIPAIRKTGKYEEKPMTSAQYLLQQAQWMVEAENRMNNIENNVAQTNQSIGNIKKDITRIEHNERRTVTSNHLTVIAYANMKGIKPNTYNSSVMGRKATNVEPEDCLQVRLWIVNMGLLIHILWKFWMKYFLGRRRVISYAAP